MSLPKPINWIRGGSTSNDLLMTLEIPKYNLDPEVSKQDIHYSQIMSLAQVKDFLYDIVNSTTDRLELKTVTVSVRDENGDLVYPDPYSDSPPGPITEEAERLVPNPPSVIDAVFFYGSDLASEDDDEGFRLNYYRKPDANLEAERNKAFATIDKYLTPPLQLSEIKCYGTFFYAMNFRPLNPIEDLDEFFGLE